MIPVRREPEMRPPFEPCCFCLLGTTHWTALPDRKPGEQVACCRRCAAEREPADVPTRDEWFAQQRGR